MRLYDKDELERFLRKNTALNIYQIGDLDDFYWNHTSWYGLKENKSLNAAVLLYKAPPFTVLLALATQNDIMHYRKLLKSILEKLPDELYAHLSPDLEQLFEQGYIIESRGKYQKMFLTDFSKLNNFDESGIRNLNESNLREITAFYEESYPENSFDPRMIKTGMYFGMKEDDKLVCISGVHVYSEQYKTAALGNITTHPDYRGKGYGQKVTAHLCRVLLTKVNSIGLNVGQDNIPAIKCYNNLGFTKTAPFLEYMIRKKK